MSAGYSANTYTNDLTGEMESTIFGNLMPFDTLTAKQAAADSHLPENRKPRSHPLAQIVDMQDQLLKAVLDPETEPQKKAQCACAWEKLEDRKRILKGIALPKPVDTTKLSKSKQTHAAPMEYIEPEQPAEKPTPDKPTE